MSELQFRAALKASIENFQEYHWIFHEEENALLNFKVAVEETRNTTALVRLESYLLPYPSPLEKDSKVRRHWILTIKPPLEGIPI